MIIEDFVSIELLRREFPLFDASGLDENEHCCEWTLLQERKRLHALLSAAPQPATPAEPTNYIQEVPDHCDRIVWRNLYYHLPPRDVVGDAAPQSAAPNLVSVVRAHCDDLRQVVPTLRAHKMFATADEVEKAISELVAAAPAKPVPESAANDLAIMLRRMIRFANKLDGDREIKVIAGNAAELLRRYELQGSPLRAKAAPVPLSDAEIDIALLHEGYMLAGEKQFFKRGIRFAEQHHGITPPAQGEQG